jgi:hypothetical protein
MADAYKIIIETGAGGSGTKAPIAGNNGETKSTKEPNKEDESSIGGYVAFKKNVAPFVKQGIQYAISTVALRTGNVERQQRIQVAYEAGSQVFGIAESIFIGSKVGGVVGAVGGAVLGIATNVIGLVQKQNTINLNRALENEQISMLNARSGATNGNRR